MDAIMNQPFSQFSPEQTTLFQIFYPYTTQKVFSIASSRARFVHYTTADSALKIFDSREVWMRKSSCMNDFMEVEHGFDCLNAAYKKRKERLALLFESKFPGFSTKLEDLFNGWLPHFRSDSYITCISEHDNDEDVTGRLSMWRAYGRRTGVAVVLNSNSFLTPSDALKAYTSPVAYLNENGFDQSFGEILDAIEKNIEIINALGEQAVLNHMFEVFRMAILCTKHPGFREEKEWRVIYTPTYQKSERLRFDIQSINGVPQPIYKIPLEDVASEGLTGIEIPNLVERIIIGPTQFPFAIRDAFVNKLTSIGVADAAKRIFISDVPLRL